MKLLTKEILKKLPPLGATENLPDEKKIAQIKFFGGSTYTYYAFEYDPEQELFFGYVTGLQEDELGYTSLAELQSLRFRPFNLPVERDKFYAPQTLAEIKERGR